MKGHRRPDLAHLSPRLDVRVAMIETPKRATLADRWVIPRLPGRGRIALPVRTNALFEGRGGEICPVVRLRTNDGRLSLRLVQDRGLPRASQPIRRKQQVSALISAWRHCPRPAVAI
jgi:hypothetical protein